MRPRTSTRLCRDLVVETRVVGIVGCGYPGGYRVAERSKPVLLSYHSVRGTAAATTVHEDYHCLPGMGWY